MVGITLSLEKIKSAPPDVRQWLAHETTRLPNMQRLLACLQLIDRTFKELRRDNDAALFTLDRRGYCVIPTETRRNILSVWSRLVAMQGEGAATVKLAFTQPFATSRTVPPASIHMEGAFPGASASEPFGVANESKQQ